MKTTVLALGLLASILTACSGPVQNSAVNALNSSTRQESSVVTAGPSDVMVQLFNYPFKKITAAMPELAEIGYAQIHVSPPNLTIDSDQWWGRYQPVDYRVIAGPLGSETEFKQMIATAHKHGIKIIVDIVFNHTQNPTSPLPAEAKKIVDAKGALFGEDDYHENRCISDYNDAWQVKNWRMCGGGGDQGLPDLDQSSPNVLKVQKEFLQRLSDMGVDGFRLDAIKHMEVDYFSKLLTRENSEGKFVFGEIIADQNTYARDIDPYLSETAMSLYDFPLRATMQEALSMKGSMRTLGSNQLVNEKKALPWNRGVTFIMNHDIPNNAGFRAWILDETDEELAYAYILGRSEGVPYVYSDLGSKGGAGLIDDRWENAFRKPSTVKAIKFHNHVAGESEMSIWVDDCVLLVQRGSKGVYGINKCAEEREFSLDQKFAEGRKLVELMTGDDLSADQTLVLPGRSARFVIAK